MSDLKKMTVVIRNSNVHARADLEVFYNRVRLEDEQGKTFYLKEVRLLKYLERHGAMAEGVPRTWYYKSLSKKSVVIVALEKPGGKVEYDLDDMQRVVRSIVLMSILVAVGLIPGGVIAATATFGLGLLLIPLGLWHGYKGVFKVPAMLRRKTLVSDLARYGIEAQ